MAKFLNTSKATLHLEELINKSTERVVLISPYLQINDKIKELLIDKNRLKVNLHIIYGKDKKQIKSKELLWLQELDYLKIGFCENLHAKCFLNESFGLIGSMNLYTFSQVNNNEMGVLFSRFDDKELYTDTLEEAQRLIRISEDLNIVTKKKPTVERAENDTKEYEKLSTSKLAKKLGMQKKDLDTKLAQLGYVERLESGFELTELGKTVGGEEKTNSYCTYCIWDSEMTI